MTVVLPEPQDRAWVHDRSFAELAEGIFRDETRDGMIAVMDRMREGTPIEAVILGGTELPLLFREGAAAPLPLLDTSSIHVDSAIARLLA